MFSLRSVVLLILASPLDPRTLVVNAARSDELSSEVNAFIILSSSSGSASSSIQPPIENATSTLPISDYSFTPFSTPTQPAVAGVFPSTNPKNPPPVQSKLKVVPDFGPTWAAAYEKAKAKVRFN